MFNERRVAQIAAFFTKAEGGRIAIIKLIKLMYLADRESLDRYGEPLTFDEMFSLRHGPILSRTLDLIKGTEDSSPGGWDDWMADRENKEVEVKDANFDNEQLDELSNADIDVLDVVWKKFGHMNKWALRDYTHSNCPEWKDPSSSRFPLPYSDVLRALGKSEQQIEHTQREIQSRDYLDRLFAQL